MADDVKAEAVQKNSGVNEHFNLLMDAEDANPDDMERPDTVLWARALCDYTGGPRGADLACNDDRMEGTPENMGMDADLQSRIEFQAEAGQTIFLFADSYGRNMPRWQGAYTLTIARQ